ncbi:MAG: hypothetical protein KDA27_26305 [Candidatus Eisenbacteria bacterium]|uniref:PH domain-containing protein n=1 Tax=Eiseniibacteriota bacterium TaxID=2212470 RepID=A0A956NK86_UNCEI|nr:hypothetical protein [Candidatus Eisenbacteria bacterium]
MTPSASPAAPTSRVYRCSPRVRYVLIGVWLILMFAPGLMIIAGLASHDTSSVEAGVAIAVLESVITLPIFWLAAWRNPRLVLTEGGVTLHQLGFRLETSWSNVVELRQGKQPGLVLETPLDSRGARRLAWSSSSWLPGSGLYDPDELSLIHSYRYIPLGPFSHWLDRGDLEQEIRRRASRLSPSPQAGVEPN